MYGSTEVILQIYNYSTSNCRGPSNTITFNLDCDGDLPSGFYNDEDDDVDMCCIKYIQNRYNITQDTCSNYPGYSLEMSCSEEPQQYLFFIGTFMCCALCVITMCLCFWVSHKKKVKKCNEKQYLI